LRVMPVAQRHAVGLGCYVAPKLVYCGQTPVQQVVIADTNEVGRVLLLDGIIQSASSDESLYHELLVQPAMLYHDHPRDVLIIGGGEGATLREVLAHPGVATATMVDIDGELIGIAKTHLQQWHQGCFHDARTRVEVADGRRFVEQDQKQYDVVIIDVCDLLDNGPAQALYTRQFYQMLRKRLRPGAILVVQALEFSFLKSAAHAALARTLSTVFGQVHSYNANIPSFTCSWGFIIASDWCDPREHTAQDCDARIASRLAGRPLQHIDGEFLAASFTACKQMRRLIASSGPIFEDGILFPAAAPGTGVGQNPAQSAPDWREQSKHQTST